MAAGFPRRLTIPARRGGARATALCAEARKGKPLRMAVIDPAALRPSGPA
jgi:hypothetical protein